MINLKLKVFGLVILLSTMCLNVIAQVGIGTTNPNSSSMLDIQSTTKGILIPRMTTVQRTTISSPPSGLLVFDTTSQGFWLYTTDWEELVSDGSIIEDADNDTKIEVEQSADEDKIRFKTLGSERMSIDNAGNTYIGDGTNNTYIESDGSLSYEGTATRWDDIKIPVTSTKKEGSKPPGYDIFKDDNSGSQGVISYKFDPDSEKELYFTVQLPHSWKEGSMIDAHVHWSAKNNVGTNKVVWGLEYTWTNIGSVFGDTAIITGDTPYASIGEVSAYEHALTEIGTLDGTGKIMSSMILCRVFRDATSSADNYIDDAYLFEIDFHFEIDSDGSRTEHTK